MRRLIIAIALAFLPLPLNGLFSLVDDAFTPPDWLVAAAIWSQNIFPGTARAARATGAAVADLDHHYDIGMMISAWSLPATLAALLWAALRGSGLITANLRRPRAIYPWEPRGFRALFGGIICLVLLLVCWITALVNLFHSGDFFIDAHKTCSYAIGTGGNEHCIRYDFLPVPAALWKLGWTTVLANLTLLLLPAATWSLWAAVRTGKRHRTS